MDSHVAHKGGNDPKERNHITAGYYKAPSGGKPGEQIKSPWSKSFEEKNPGKPTKGLFHVYPEDQRRRRTSLPLGHMPLRRLQQGTKQKRPRSLKKPKQTHMQRRLVSTRNATRASVFRQKTKRLNERRLKQQRQRRRRKYDN